MTGPKLKMNINQVWVRGQVLVLRQVLGVFAAGSQRLYGLIKHPDVMNYRVKQLLLSSQYP